MASGPANQPPHALGLFDTTIVVDEMPGAAAFNAALLAVIRQWGGELSGRLLGRMVAAAERFTVDVAAQGKPRFRWAAEMWANISGPDASNQYHAHPGAFWSAVYYIDDGYGGSADPALGGELVLQDPRMPMIMMTMPTLRFKRPDRPPDEPELAMRPVAGRLVMFPAWLNHCVMRYRGSSERVSIAANLSAVPIG
jgi:uncharacterized protein (TIGR02466 family)